MKLQEFRKQACVGQKWAIYHHILDKNLGEREISRLIPRGVAFKDDKGELLLYYPKPTSVYSSWKSVDENTFQIYQQKELVMTYKRLCGDDLQ
jgi:hypothetical protein